MKILSFLSLLSLAFAVLPASAQTVEDLQIKERSFFTASTARNPFLPVGWAKPEPIVPTVGKPVNPTAVVSDAFFKPERFVVTSISIGALPLALINGKTYGEGDLIPVEAGINVQVYAIRDGEVTLRYQSKTIVSAIQSAEAKKQRPKPKH